jgi:aspartyl-tRNA(Asn)/glutamyl-tRNA(Gln) amidotransferase subunit B
MAWEIVVGIETHAQLRTKSKIFSGASTAFGAAPNTQASAVDIALPGVLPVLNKAAVDLAIRFGLAVNGTINKRSIFARKNYFYPDLPKGYQISQYEIPVVQGGSVKIMLPNGEKTIRLTRAHLEEDAGKSLHEDFHGMSGIDLNRAGTPLLEIVSEPDLRGAKEAVAYAKKIHEIVTSFKICDGNMQEGSFRCDANVSVRKVGDTALGTRCEIKNLNSFRFMEQAIEFEARRQIELIEDGNTVTQETRLFDPERGETRTMRTKEDAQDYRYFPDPDLLPLEISDEYIEKIRQEMPMALDEIRNELRAVYISVPAGNISVITATADLANFSTKALSGTSGETSSIVANLIAGPLSARLNQENLDISKSKISPDLIRALAIRISDGSISNSTAVGNVMPAMWSGEGSPDEIIERKGLKQVSDAGTIEKIVDEVLAANVKQVEDYRSGKEKAFNALVGQVMKASKGKANPAQVNEILRRKLKA